MKQVLYQVNGVSLNVWEEGPTDGKPIVFLHGFPEGGFAWKEQLSYFAAHGYRALAPDQRGYNKSSKPRQTGAYRMTLLVQDIVELIGLVTNKPVILVGHDWGGGVAWHLAMHYPQLLERLVIINMPHPQVIRQTLISSNRQKLRSSYVGFFQLPLLPEWVSGMFNFKLLERTLLRTSYPNTFSRTQLLQYKLAWAQPGALTGMINWYRAYRFSKPKPAGPIAVPALIIWGKKDAFLLAEMAQKSATHCTHAQLELVDRATHWIHHEQPGLVNSLIYSFVNKEHQDAQGAVNN